MATASLYTVYVFCFAAIELASPATGGASSMGTTLTPGSTWLFVRSSHCIKKAISLLLYIDRIQRSSIRLTKFRGLCVICPPMPISRRGRSCHLLSLGSAGISPSTGPDGTTKLIFGLAVRGSISSNFEKGSPSFSRSHTEFTKLEMCHRSSTVVLSANEGIGVPFTPVDMVLKIVSILYGSSLLPLKFQHLCQSAGWIGTPQSSFRLKGLPSPRPSIPWHSTHFLSTISWAPFSRLSLL